MVLTFADTGAGMSASAQKKLFDAFYTTKGIGGTGLGLWVSRDIIERHAGRVLLRSRENRGTVFTIFLPYDAIVRTLSESSDGIRPIS